MARIITYSLKLSSSNSDEYYQTISAFAEYWLDHIKCKALIILTSFREYLHKSGIPIRTEEEVAFELLALGVFLQQYHEKAHGLSEWSFHVLTFLADLRVRWPKSEVITKKITGWVNGMTKSLPNRKANGNEILELIAWLKSSGENLKAERFQQWRDFTQTSVIPTSEEVFRICLNLSSEFEQAGMKSLGKYTEMVDTYLTTSAIEHRWKYDSPLVSKSRLEYHLGMLGTEILNNVYRQDFLFTDRKIVIVPPCMSAPEKKCKATETPFGAKCNSCTPSCRVNQITRMGEKCGFDVFIIPDDMKKFNTQIGTETIGLVGVSCALTNWNGGWETNSLKIPAQGMLLDYVGCKYHWDRVGFPTDCNLKKLQAILGISPNKELFKPSSDEKQT
jgi:uncharacterized protein